MSAKVNRAGNTTSRARAIDAQRPAASQPRLYNSEPATRPADIPWGQTLPNGQYAPIYYDPASRGYGFWDMAGHWVLWSAVMNNGPRYYGGGYGASYGPGYGAHHSSSPFSSLFGLLFVGGIVVAGIYLYRKQSNEVSSILDRSRGKDDFSPVAPVARAAASVPVRRSPQLTPWLTFPPGSFITLSDNQSMTDSQQRGEGFKGIRFAVESTTLADDTEGFGTWVMIRLNDNHQRVMLMVKSVDDALDYRVYFALEEFHPARREEVIRRGDTWLFEPPEDENDYDPADLRYTAEVVQNTANGEVVYVRKEQGERHANATETPNPLGLTKQVATIVEYSTVGAAENPEFLVLEIGSASRRTGEVGLYLGCPIRESEIDVLKASPVV